MPHEVVTILINNYNYGRFLSAAIESALAQTYCRTEIIVTDDGSTDESREILRSYSGRVKVRLKDNGGQASAINAGFSASTGQVICLLDADDRFEPTKAAQVAEWFQKDESLGWVFHHLQQTDLNGTHLSPEHPGTMEPAIRVDVRRRLRQGKQPGFTLPGTSGLSFRRSTLQRILPMPESLRITSDLFIRVAALSLAPGVIFPDRLAQQLIHGDNAYSRRDDIARLKCLIRMETAYYLRSSFPEIRRYADLLYASSAGVLVGSTGIRGFRDLSPEVRWYLARDNRAWSLPRQIVRALRSFAGYGVRRLTGARQA